MDIKQCGSTERKLTKNKSTEMKQSMKQLTLAALVQKEEEGEAEGQGGGH